MISQALIDRLTPGAIIVWRASRIPWRIEAIYPDGKLVVASPKNKDIEGVLECALMSDEEFHAEYYITDGRGVTAEEDFRHE